MMEKIKNKVRAIKREVIAIYYACRDPKCPWYAKVIAMFVVAYALSPIDLIPDFIPVLGYLDDLILVSFGVAFLLKLIPVDVMEKARERAEKVEAMPKSTFGFILVFLLWICVGVLIIRYLLKVKS